MISQGLPIYVALEPVDMRLGYERLGGLVRERMQAEPRSKALFVFVGKRGHTMKVLTWDGTGAIVQHFRDGARHAQVQEEQDQSDQANEDPDFVFLGIFLDEFEHVHGSVPVYDEEIRGEAGHQQDIDCLNNRADPTIVRPPRL